LTEIQTKFPSAVGQVPSKKQTDFLVSEERHPYHANIHVVECEPYSMTNDGTPFFRRSWHGDIH
jgi:hypothetical protein